jgi:5-methylcytosine-specific restriction endonuclease McrA
MPVHPDNRARYPANWREISLGVRERAEWRCEECGAENHRPHPDTGSHVVLTVSHTDHQPENNDPSNLRALCQRCHLAHDREHHAESRARRKAAQSAAEAPHA